MSPVKQRVYDFLRESRYFENVSAEQILEILELAHIQIFQKGQIILKQNEINEVVHFLISGKLAIKVDDEIVYVMSRTGDIFGEMSVITGEPCSATVEAFEDVETISIATPNLISIHEDMNHNLHGTFYHWMSRILSERLKITTQKAKLFEIMNREFKQNVDNAKAFQQDLFSARLDTIPNFPLSMKCEFADILGGDFYGVFYVQRDMYGIVIGDVSGHGIAASLLAVNTLNLFQLFSRAVSSSKRVMDYINNLSEAIMPHERFVVCLYLIYDAQNQELLYTHAGKQPALVLRGAEIIPLDQTPGLALGITPSDIACFSEEFFPLEPGDRLILFTDAVCEVFENSGKNDGMDNLIGFICENANLPSNALVAQVYAQQNRLQAGAQADDFLFMVFDQQSE
ncbi:MAG: SpoIIE family protein phosphatase [SAR324 cluster bacterium]|nr:SpoIIE family protein phosphatase [SAR324 cluster bacterium]